MEVGTVASGVTIPTCTDVHPGPRAEGPGGVGLTVPLPNGTGCERWSQSNTRTSEVQAQLVTFPALLRK